MEAENTFALSLSKGSSLPTYLFSVRRPDRYLWMTLDRSV